MNAGKFILMGIALVLCSTQWIACTNYEAVAKENNSNLLKLSIGDSKQQVLKVMGEL